MDSGETQNGSEPITALREASSLVGGLTVVHTLTIEGDVCHICGRIGQGRSSEATHSLQHPGRLPGGGDFFTETQGANEATQKQREGCSRHQKDDYRLGPRNQENNEPFSEQLSCRG